MEWLVLIVLVLVLLAVLGYSRSWVYGPSGTLGLIIVILIILALVGVL